MGREGKDNGNAMIGEPKKYLFIRKMVNISVVFGLIFFAYRFGVEQGRGDISQKLSSPSLSGFFSSESSQQKNVDLSIFWKSWDLLKERYVDANVLTDDMMVEGAVRGIFSATGDSYTTFLNAEENKQLESDIAGSFEGIGAEIGIRNKILTVIAPLPDSPAEKAGLRSGDKILKINEEETMNMGLEQAVKKMRGEKGTEVTFTVFREGEEETRQIVVVRDVIFVKNVTVEYKDGDIAYIQLTLFGENTARELDVIVQDIQTRGVKGIVLDLRNNPGGLLAESIAVSGKFLERGSAVVSEEYGDGKKDIEKTTGKGELKNIPLVVLVNEGSASASEILAGALRDNRQDVSLVGKKTFGKGSVQELIPLPGGNAAKITVAQWFTPSGKGIDREGITPDREVDLTQEDFDADRDPQLDRALEILRSER